MSCFRVVYHGVGYRMVSSTGSSSWLELERACQKPECTAKRKQRGDERTLLNNLRRGTRQHAKVLRSLGHKQPRQQHRDDRARGLPIQGLQGRRFLLLLLRTIHIHTTSSTIRSSAEELVKQPSEVGPEGLPVCEQGVEGCARGGAP